MENNPYDTLGQGGYKASKAKYNFLDVLDKKDRLKYDPEGKFIPKQYRIKFKKFMQNPRGLTPGTAFESIMSGIPETPNFLSQFSNPNLGSNPISQILARQGGGI